MPKGKEYHLSSAHNFQHIEIKKILKKLIAQVVELVDTRDLKSLEGNFVPVQVRLRVPLLFYKNTYSFILSKNVIIESSFKLELCSGD